MGDRTLRLDHRGVKGFARGERNNNPVEVIIPLGDGAITLPSRDLDPRKTTPPEFQKVGTGAKSHQGVRHACVIDRNGALGDEASHLAAAGRQAQSIHQVEQADRRRPRQASLLPSTISLASSMARTLTTSSPPSLSAP